MNETIPLGGAYRLMMASRDRPVSDRYEPPRATADWNWSYWTDLGPVQTVTRDMVDEALSRLS